MPGRVLLVLFSTARGYTLATWADRVMIAKDGGSSWRWSVVSKFRYQQNDFFLIGESMFLTRTSGDCESLDSSPGGDYQDTNFVTGEYELRKISETCQALLHRKGRPTPVALRRLADYAPEP